MTTILTQIQKDQKEYYSIQAPPQVAQLEGSPRICGLCSSTTHYTNQCHQIQEEHALVVANVNYNNRPPYPSLGQNNYSHGSNQNQGWRDNGQGNNQNQRWNNSSSHYNNNHQANQNHHNQNQNNYTKYQALYHRQQSNQSSSSSTNQVDELRATVDKRDEGYKAQFEAMNAQSANITDMISKMAMSSNNTNQPSSSSSLPSQPQPNPKGGLNTITLRSGTTLEEIPPRIMEDIHEEEVVVEAPHEEDEVDKRQDEEGVSLKEPKRKAIVDESVPIPFPSLVKKAKKTPEFDLNMLQVFKKVEVTIPLFDAIQQILRYAKFLKDLCTHKDRIGELETLSLVVQFLP
ncbi:hypothetical protein Ahy_B01g053959 isoform A [Arachis hypogaea]|uniref:Uncharacterized protein n=1 Tax=Arachis hypogaea TaxID=3818 RepID=A0A445AT08_ARAHY|nr:hypothetical protein Ahy_B01g053959 isoform A [Arachis hypogaea]